ncbi:addiction module protein [Leptolyngbya sp. BC1307]|uniref:addiction module protein n=1 Tax=Leptolyngbya sp. BC1307 TaxID=2029589 RepID=UPI000EFACC17|nr:addiction module protein [Leptolyngbya sp. BC1307]
MQSLLTIEMSQMSVAERIQLAEDLWNSILSGPEGLPVTELQKEELDHRLERHSQNPEAGSSWEIVKERLNNQQ